MTHAIAPWIEELAATPLRFDVASGSSPETARRRAASRAFESTLPALYRWARLDHPLIAKRVQLPIPCDLPIGKSVVFLGPPGLGKTTLAVALLRALFERDLARASLESDDEGECVARRFRFTHAHRIGVARLGGVEGAAELQAAIRPPVLVLDDLGAEAKIPSNAVPEVITERHAEERATWITTGLSPSEIATRYGGGVARRILEFAVLYRFERRPEAQVSRPGSCG